MDARAMTSTHPLRGRTPTPLRQLRLTCARHGATAFDLPSGRKIAGGSTVNEIGQGGDATRFRAPGNPSA